ncbi:MAG TPA: DNA repair protein RecO [Candidatus Saccharimonadales bacterium]|nr:DNA repair protein RecO [Candidatus Saccharimonadales bacterium]
MKQIVTIAIVLSRTDFGEADRILTVMTRDNGKVRLLARGVRKVKSKLAGGIELFGVNQISFIVGKGEIRTLTSSRLEKHYKNIVKDVERTMFGYEILKIVNQATEDAVGAEYFELLDKTLEAIDNQAVDIDLIRLWFYLQLLKLGGHSPNLKTDTADNPLDEKQKYTFDFEKMAFALSSGSRYSAQHIKLLRLGLGLKSPISLKSINDSSKVTSSCLQLAKSMLEQYVRI